MTIRYDAEYTEPDGRPTVTFRRPLPHDPADLWRAVSDPAELAHWFPSPDVHYEERVGGPIRLSGDPYDPDGSTGTVLAWDPPGAFGFEWGEDRLHLHVEPHEHGALLTLVDELETEGGAARNAAGWDMCLEALEAALDGRAADPVDGGMAAFVPVLRAYAERGFPDDGQVPGDQGPDHTEDTTQPRST